MDDKERFLALEAAAIAGSLQGLKALLLLNGGASVSLLTFVGALATSEHLRPEFVNLVQATTQSLLFFGAGAGIAVLSCFFAYWANQGYANSIIDGGKGWWQGSVLSHLGVVVALSSLACFGWGLFLIARSVP
ncbi:MAG TPA: hypothetical protein VGO22_04940 [Pseudorhizobium sp.]|nr:hypothetical protein [Pseudorhizobium sp.]